jgi:hypothetical protein
MMEKSSAVGFHREPEVVRAGKAGCVKGVPEPFLLSGLSPEGRPIRVEPRDIPPVPGYDRDGGFLFLPVFRHKYKNLY